jgi:hypothetical protein
MQKFKTCSLLTESMMILHYLKLLIDLFQRLRYGYKSYNKQRANLLQKYENSKLLNYIIKNSCRRLKKLTNQLNITKLYIRHKNSCQTNKKVDVN